MLRKNRSERIARFFPAHVGGPGTLLPRILESILSWVVAIGCLSVALWHYQNDRCRAKLASADKRCRKHRYFLPLTTHSRREWLTVSDYRGLRARYHQLLELIHSSIISTKTSLVNEEKKDDENEEPLSNKKYLPAHGNSSEKNQTGKKGEVVAKWLAVGSVCPTQIQMSQSTELAKGGNCEIETRFFDDEGDNLQCSDSQETLVDILRSNDIARRLASLLLGEDPIGIPVTSTNGISNSTATKNRIRRRKEQWLDRLSSEEPGAEIVLQALEEIWPKVMELPVDLPPANKSDCRDNAETIKISVIVPAFREDGGQLASKLHCSMKNAIEPHRIEIIVVHVMENTSNQHREAKDKNGESSHDNLSSFAKSLREHFTSTKTQEGSRRSASTIPLSGHPVLRILEYHGGGGRGPCLNYGAMFARGNVLSFLHGDTRLITYGWDKAILKALEVDESGGPRTTCCFFSFAVDTSPDALTVRTKKARDCDKNKSRDSTDSSFYERYYPPGMRAVEVTANLRSKMFWLPYGDMSLHLPTEIFRHIGGFPDQCLMEDYELMRLLRTRSAAGLARSSSLGPDSAFDQGQETIKFLSDYKALCSPRRWQKDGVLYVTYMNSYCVNRYNSGEVTPDGIFCEYYGTTTPPNRTNGERSPWEAKL